MSNFQTIKYLIQEIWTEISLASLLPEHAITFLLQLSIKNALLLWKLRITSYSTQADKSYPLRPRESSLNNMHI